MFGYIVLRACYVRICYTKTMLCSYAAVCWSKWSETLKFNHQFNGRKDPQFLYVAPSLHIRPKGHGLMTPRFEEERP